MKNKLNRPIFYEEYAEINGIQQYLFHAGTKDENPVLLFLHGGPGGSEVLLAHIFQEKWEEIFTVVHWDQRGAGKTQTKNKNSYLDIEVMIKDLYDVIQHLKKKYNKEKIILLGHSWGSVLGSLFIKKYPMDIAYYIGVGQVIDIVRNEKTVFEKVKQVVLESNDKKSIKALKAIGEYPGESFNHTNIKKMKQVRGLMSKHKLLKASALQLMKIMFNSPLFKLTDIYYMFKENKANDKLLDYLGEYDLTSQSLEYEVPVYYILGADDWVTPTSLVVEYFNTIKAPNKEIFIIPNSSHSPMITNTDLFYDKLVEINNKEK